MNKPFKTLGLASAAAFALSLSAQAQNATYTGNGNYGFNGTPGDGPVGDGMLTFSSDGTTLTGTITPGPNNGAGNNGELYDELVIYISTGGTGSNTTAGFSDDGGGANGDRLREAVSGYDATTTGTTVQSIVDFAPGFNANYAIALSPVAVQYSGVYALPGVGTATASSFGYLGTASLTPTNAAGPYTFSIALATIGSPKSFKFATTYLNTHSTDTVSRSDEAFNSLTDLTTPANGTGGNDPGLDTVSLGFDTFPVVPEPGTWAMMLGGIGMLLGFQRRLRRKA